MSNRQDYALRHKQLSPRVRDALTVAKGTDRLEMLLVFDSKQSKPMDARKRFEAIDGLHVAQGYPPILSISGPKTAIVTALSDALATGAAMDFQDYCSYHLTIKRKGNPGAER